MTATITAFEQSPDGGTGCRVTCAFAGFSTKWASPATIGRFRSM